MIIYEYKRENVMNLDVGCGTRRRGDIGIDIYRKSQADIIADAHYLPLRDTSFDSISAYAVLEHVDDPRKVLSEIHRVCKNGGFVKILVPASSRMFLNFIIYFVTFQFGMIHEMFQCNKRREHKWQYSVSGLSSLLKRQGFHVLDVEFSPPNFHGANNAFLRILERIHRRIPLYKPHLVVEGKKQ